MKTATQLTVSLLSLCFIVESCFFVPGHYDASVWSRESVAWIYIVQGAFEVADLSAELWMLSKESGRDHLPWDSILHHGTSAAYAFYISWRAPVLDMGFLGLTIAALSCQVIGPLYTLHRWRFKHPHLALAILIVQLGYRCPLAVVSIIRAIQYFNEAPFPHILIILCLSYLDYKWLGWAFNLYRRRQEQKNEKQQEQEQHSKDGSASVTDPFKPARTNSDARETLTQAARALKTL